MKEEEKQQQQSNPVSVYFLQAPHFWSSEHEKKAPSLRILTYCYRWFVCNYVVLNVLCCANFSFLHLLLRHSFSSAVFRMSKLAQIEVHQA